MKKIGILGGLGPQSTELFYHELIRLCQTREMVEYPNILINSVEMWKFVDDLDNRALMVNLVKKEIDKIHDDVDVIAIPCNTIHFIIDEMRAHADVPVMAIYEEVIKEVKRRGIKKVGILGTKTTVSGDFYQKELEENDIEFAVLNDRDEDELNSLIWEKMLSGKGYGEMHDLLIKDVRLLEEMGSDGVILACTELPLFISEEDVGVDLFSSTHILAKSVFERVFE